MDTTVIPKGYREADIAVDDCCFECQNLFGTAALPLCVKYDTYVKHSFTCDEWKENVNATQEEYNGN